MQRGKPLEGRSQLARTTPLKPRSEKQERVYVTRRALVAKILRERPWCEIRWDAGCQRRSTQVHEPEMRSRRPGAELITDEKRCVAACGRCHAQVHANPAEATRRGWMVPSGEAA